MPGQLSEQEREEFLGGVHVGVLSVARDGSAPPLASPLWYAYQPGGNLSFFTGTEGRRAHKAALVRRAGVVTLTVQQETYPYRYVSVGGTVVGDDAPPSEEQMLAICRRYLPEEEAQGYARAELSRPDSQLVVFTVRPDRWVSADYSEER